jgi:CRISPR/Cas system-associated exonuclease Cas4 (RecB family)|tara:strand:- start:2960 stop:3790 length:831 start_codon:yes stop_codon:yes gene_type:complete
MEEKQIRVSQSIIKALARYTEGKECGLVIEHQYVKGAKIPPSEVQNLGNWFEYECTGALPPYDPVKPEPKILKSGKMAVGYERMLPHIENYKAAIKHYNVTDITPGIELKYGNIAGTADIIAKINGKPVIIDIKTTGLFDDKWNDYGWRTDHLAGEFRPKIGLLTQPLHYKWLYKQIYKEDPDFYFWIFSTQNSHDFKIIKVNIEEELYEVHAQEIQSTLNFLLHSLENGFKAKPSISRCAKCHFKETCDFEVKIPEVEEVWYSTNIKDLGRNIGD